MSQPKPTMDGLQGAAAAAQALYAALADSYDLPKAGWTVGIREPFYDIGEMEYDDEGVMVFVVTIDVKGSPGERTLHKPTHITYPIRSKPKESHEAAQ